MNALGDDARLVLGAGVACSWLGGEVVLLDPSGEMLRGVNGQGGRLLSLLDGRKTVSELAAIFDDGHAVRRLLSELVARGLIVPAAGAVVPGLVMSNAPALLAPALVWEQQFVGLQVLSDPCSQNPPPGYCGSASRFGDFGGGAQGN